MISLTVAKRTLQKYTDEHVLTNTEYDYDDSIEDKWLKLLNQIANQLSADIPHITDKEIKIDAEKYLDKIIDLIYNISKDPSNWMVSAIHDNNSNEPRRPSSSHHSKYNNNNNNKLLFANNDDDDNNEVTRVDFKPLDVSRECRKLLNKCDITLTMSATILDIDEYCKSVGLDRDEVKFIQVAESEFPVESRLIYELNAIEVTQKTLSVLRHGTY